MEQLSRCTVKIRHNDKSDKCRFCVVPGDSPALLRMRYIELLSIIRIICETMGIKTTSKSLTHKAIQHWAVTTPPICVYCI